MQAINSKARVDMIETAGRFCHRLGLPRSTGRIYGLLFLSAHPLSLDDMVELLGISKGSASIGTRQLRSLGAIQQVWVRGDRHDYFEVVEDLGGLLRSSYTDYVKPRIESSRRHLESMLGTLEEECAHGVIGKEEFKVCFERLKNLQRLQKKAKTIAPFLERFL